jgi:cell division protease FtsH
MVVGVGAARVRDLFAEARKAAPAIIFVDELDAIGRRRGAWNVMGGNDEREQTLNQLLIEMDGFSSRVAVIVLAATNRSDVLDPALLRPGRFDRRVTVQPPDRAGRAEILKVHTRGVPLAPDVNPDAIAAETPGLVGADLRNLVNEAALLAARKEHNAVTATDFSEALEKIALGAERRLALAPEERERVAYHEAGHALLGLLQPEGDPVRRVTVIPRGQALGVTLSVPEADRYNYGEPYLRARIVGALGGRAAEQVVYGTVTTGAENDLKQVTDIARAMVTRWGMSQEVGLVALSGSDDGNFLEIGAAGGATRAYSEATAEAIDRATRRIVDDSYRKAIDMLTTNRARLDALTQALLREESLDETQMREVTQLPRQRARENTIAAQR